MENTKNEMTPFAKDFYRRLKLYLDTKIYYYGSIQRDDYFPTLSDIDVDIFTDNIPSTIAKLQIFLNVDRNAFKRFIYRLHKSKKMVHGYKVKYSNKEHNFSTEFAIYNENDKEGVLYEHKSKIILPVHVAILLYILKYIYYKMRILPKPIYFYYKKLLMNYFVEGEDVEYIILD